MIIPSTHLSLFLPLQNGDQSDEGWKAFHARYHEVILTWCLRRELPSGWAEDLTQEIWLKLLREIRNYDPAKGRLRSWLKAVVNNFLTDYWRRQRVKPERGGVGGSAFLERLAACASPEAAEELSIAIEGKADTSAAEVLARVRARLHETTERRRDRPRGGDMTDLQEHDMMVCRACGNQERASRHEQKQPHDGI